MIKDEQELTLLFFSNNIKVSNTAFSMHKRKICNRHLDTFSNIGIAGRKFKCTTCRIESSELLDMSRMENQVFYFELLNLCSLISL